MGVVLKRALKDPTFAFIFIGFFSCGYQLAFITAHFPAFISEMCSAVAPGSVIQSLGVSSTTMLGALSIALIGFFNIGGTLLAGWLAGWLAGQPILAQIPAG